MFRSLAMLVVGVSIVVGSRVAQSQALSERTPLPKTEYFGVGVAYGVASKYNLLRRPEILRQLKVTDSQLARLTKAREEVDRALEHDAQEKAALIQRMQRRKDSDGLAAYRQATMNELFSLTTESELPLLKVLDGRQRSRLEQIQLRADGPGAFRRPQVQERLNLSPEQIEMILAIENQWQNAFSEAATVPPEIGPVPGGLSPEKKKALLGSKRVRVEIEKSRNAVISAREKTMRQILQVLYKRQRATYEKLIGEPFEFSNPLAEGKAVSKDGKPEEPVRPAPVDGLAGEKTLDKAGKQ
jgi:hypothetical protein